MICIHLYYVVFSHSISDGHHVYTFKSLAGQNLLLDIQNMTKSMDVWTLTSTQSYAVVLDLFLHPRSHPLTSLISFTGGSAPFCRWSFWSKFQDLQTRAFVMIPRTPSHFWDISVPFISWFCWSDGHVTCWLTRWNSTVDDLIRLQKVIQQPGGVKGNGCSVWRLRGLLRMTMTMVMTTMKMKMKMKMNMMI